MKQFKKITIFVILASFCLANTPYSYTKPKKKRSQIRHSIKKKVHQDVQKLSVPFSKSVAHYFDWMTHQPDNNTYIWQSEAPIVFDELILSWNARRPSQGYFTFWVSVKHHTWSPWHRIAEWGSNYQQTFVNKLNPYVHTKHVRVEMQRKLTASQFRIKVVFQGGAPYKNLHAIFVSVSHSKNFRRLKPNKKNPSLLIHGIPKQSQMVLDHYRNKELCSPTSLCMIIKYFQHKFYDALYMRNLHMYATVFADKVHDDGYLDIYGSWPLNVAQAYEASEGDVFYCIERLNSFDDLYNYLEQKIPVAVSVRRLKGGATPYSGGHFLVVVGWDQAKQKVLCLDPAFRPKAVFKGYKINNFLHAWALSRNLAYVPIPKKVF